MNSTVAAEKACDYSCRSCSHADAKTVFTMPNMPLANALLKSDEINKPEFTYPIDLVLCQNCSLLQIKKTISPSTLFSDYVYFSSYSKTMLSHAEELVRTSIHDHPLTKNSFVVEIGSNDGYLLQFYKRRGIPVLGVEPARNVAEVASSERGIPVLCEFFGIQTADRIRSDYGSADIIHAHNVLAHVSDLKSFLKGMRRLLKQGGRVIIEVPYVRDMLDRGEFDTIYHEHLSYFSVHSIQTVLRECGLRILSAQRVAIHGGSIRVTAGGDSGAGYPSKETLELLEQEREWGYSNAASYTILNEKAEETKEKLTILLNEIKRQGKRIAAYGASAKGSVLLNYAGIDGRVIDFVVDRNPHKHGRFLPGVHLPICSPERLAEDAPDYLLILSWNISDEIIQQQKQYHDNGGRFIIPIPSVRIV